jgi:hypothetical protein
MFTASLRTARVSSVFSNLLQTIVLIGSLNVETFRNKFIHAIMLLIDCKGKAIPLQVWTSPKDSRRLRFPDFKTISA